jgi:hypothetical protein
MTSQHEINEAKSANKFWYNAFIEAAKIMIDRRKKYSGNEHPYFNFAKMAQLQNKSLHEIFLFYIGIKFSRLLATQSDFKDESLLDTFLDIANYALLAAGSIQAKLQPDQILPPVQNWIEEKWPIIWLDFDGVFNQYDGVWTGEFRMYPVAEDIELMLQSLINKGYTIGVLTARPDENLPAVVEWLEEHGLMSYIECVTNKKLPGVIYPDDRGLQFISPRQLLAEIPFHKPHWEK